MTTLELADQIANAVIDAYQVSGNPDQAVLKVLRETGHWFCRAEPNPDAHTAGTRAEVDVCLPWEPDGR